MTTILILVTKINSDYENWRVLAKVQTRKGYSQEYLADVLGVSQKTYSNIENEKSNITLDTLKVLIELYKIDVNCLDIQKLIIEGQLKETKTDLSTLSNSSTAEYISIKLIHQMEERIAELKVQNDELKSRLVKYE